MKAAWNYYNDVHFVMDGARRVRVKVTFAQALTWAWSKAKEVKASELNKGDIVRFAYGYPNNIVTGVVKNTWNAESNELHIETDEIIMEVWTDADGMFTRVKEAA